MSTLPPPPPPLLSTVSTAAAIPQQRSSSISSTSSSIIIVIIVIASAIIVSASIYLLIRCLSRRFHRSFRTFSAADDVISPRHNNNNDHILCFDNNSAASQLLNSLPLFTFGSLTGNVAGGDCAVCLSKFDREDRLRLLPLCCHAFHAECIDTWLVSNQTCPLCRSSVYPTEAEVLNKILSISDDQPVNRNGIGDSNRNGNSFRIEIGSISRGRGQSDSGRRSYSIGSFDYIVDDGYEISVGSTHQRGLSECTSVDKESTPEPPGESVAAHVASGGGGGGGSRSWLRDYVERVSFSLSSRTVSFRGSGGFFTGSSRRNETVVPVDDLEANEIGEEISELFRWLSGV